MKANQQDGELRWTSVLSMDLVGYTELTHQLGEETVYALLRDVLQLADAAIDRAGGYVVDTAGDGILATFGAPKALENAPLQSCIAATDILAELSARSGEMNGTYGILPEVRIGLAGGNVMIVRQGETNVKVVGDPVNMAARLQAAAQPGSALITEDIQAETLGRIIATGPDMLELKGFDQSVSAFKLVNVIESSTRFEAAQKRGVTAFQSRTQELNDALSTFIGATPASGLLISGAAGIGKSRLLQEILDALSSDRTTMIGQCAPDKSARPFAPFESIFAQLSRSDTTSPLRDQLNTIRDRYPNSSTVAGIDRFCSPRANEKDRVGRVLHDRDFLVQMLAEVAHSDAHIFVFEDIHWADGSTLETLQTLVASGTPFIATTREPSEELGASPLHHIALAPLQDQDIAAIVGQVSAQSLPPALSDRLVQVAEGIPLIAEELALAVKSTKGQVTDANDIIFTGNLQQLVLTRVDRLEPAQKSLLQFASAIGRDFDLNLLTDASSSQLEDIDDFQGIITQLDDRTGRFSHALIREAVYSGLLRQQRKDIHLKIAQALAKQDQTTDLANLADHYVRAGQPKMAAPILVEAGEDAFQAYDLPLTDTLLTQAFEIASDDPDCLDDTAFAKLAQTWVSSLSVSANYGRMNAYADPLLHRLSQGGYSTSRSITSALIALARTGARDYAGARDLLLQIIDEANENKDAYGAAWAKSTLVRVYDETLWEPQDVTRAMCRDILPVAELEEDRLLLMTALYILLASYRACGMRTKALQAADDLEAMADKYQDRRARGYANWARAMVHIIAVDPESAAAFIDAAKKDFVPDTTDSRVIHGLGIFTEIFQKPAKDIRPKIEKLLSTAHCLKDYSLIHSVEFLKSSVELKSGSLARGWRLTNQQVKDFTKAGNQNVTRQIHTARAELLLAVTGLTDPDAEAPPSRPKVARERQNLADLITFIRLKLTGKAKAVRELNYCIDLDPQKRGVNFARAHIGLGLIAASRRQKSKARNHLEIGLKHAQDEGIDVLIHRATKALEAL